MAKYYGVVRSEEYLSHYGIKGMKWGVQKAKAAGDTNALSKHYAKASKKLTKLKNKADLNYQLEKKKDYSDRTKLAALDAGIAGGYTAARLGGLGQISLVGAGATAVGLGRAVYNSAKTMGYGSRLTARGHKKAEAKRDKFESEMNKAFSGTKYAVSKKNQSVKKPTKNSDEIRLTAKQKQLEQQWRDAQKEAKIAHDKANGLFVSKKNQAAYDAANQKTRNAFDAFTYSMTKKQRKQYHDRYLG